MKEREVSSPETARPEPVILIITNKFDPHADIIINHLHEQKIPFVRFNTEDFPLRVSLTVLIEGITHSEELLFPNNPQIKGSDITAVWYRRPASFEFPTEFSPAIHVFADRESQAAIRGLWQLLECLWVNHPEKNRTAELKLNQLKTASRLGLEIPKTLVTNDPKEAKRFFRLCSNKVIIKCLDRAVIEEEPEASIIYTSVIKKRNMENVEKVKYTPTFFQEYVPKKIELRITVVGEKVFAAAIHSQTHKITRHDWRRDILSLPHREYQLPKETEQKCIALVQSFGLYFGAIDMILTPDGRYVFLEINPNGQWAWIEELTGMPISEALIELLAGRQKTK